jgi:hypothetical protein
MGLPDSHAKTLSDFRSALIPVCIMVFYEVHGDPPWRSTTSDLKQSQGHVGIARVLAPHVPLLRQGGKGPITM